MKSSSRNLLIGLVVVGAFAAAGFSLLARSLELPEHPLERAPANAEMAAWVDVPAVLGSPTWKRLVVDEGHDAALRGLRRRCGFDPLAQVRSVTAFVSGEPGSLDHVGFVAEGDFDHERLGECLRSAIGEEGGTLEKVEIEGAPAIAGDDSSRAAFVGETGIVLGHEEVVAETLRAIAEREGRLGSDEAMRGLWDRLARGRDVVAVAKVPERWLRRVLLAERANILEPHLSALRMIGLGARLSRGLELELIVATDSEKAAAELTTLLHQALGRLSQNPLVAFSPLGELLSRVEAAAKGTEITLSLELDEARLGRMLDLAGRMLEEPPRQPGAPVAPETPPVAPETPPAAPSAASTPPEVPVKPDR